MAQFACEGYGVDALDFVIKPLSYPDFSMKFSRAVRRIDTENEHEYTIKVAGGMRRVRLQDIRISSRQCPQPPTMPTGLQAMPL